MVDRYLSVTKILIILFFFNTFVCFGKDKELGGNIQYEYKKYEKFDFGDLMIQGNNGSIGDLSINPRFKIDFKNELPRKPNFHKEMMDSVENIL